MFLDNILTSNGVDVIAKRIYEVIKDAQDIEEKLKLLYRQGLFGSDAKIKRRLRNRMYTIRRNNK